MQTIIVENIIAGSVAKFEMEDEAEVTYWIDKKFWGKGRSVREFPDISLVLPGPFLQVIFYLSSSNNPRK
jgi:hypothetical protein